MTSSKKLPLSVRIPKVLKRYKDEALRGVYGRSGPWARFARFPISMLEPWRAEEIHLLRPQGLGDVLLCTPAIRELKRRNPHCRVHFYTDYPALVLGLPYIDDVHPTSQAPVNSLVMDYKNAIPVQAHIARVIGDGLGLCVSDVTPDCVVDPKLVQKWRDAWSRLPRPHILILRRASSWTPNKDWQDASWVELMNGLASSGTVIETGATDELLPMPHENYVDLRGSTSLQELVGAVAAADLYIGPISGAMHIAAAVKTPAIVIAGGYEHPCGVKYTGQTYMYTSAPCSPCWLRGPCTSDKMCLSAITPAAVTRLVQERLAEGAELSSELAPNILEFAMG